MSNRTVNTPQVTPPLFASANQLDVNPPTSIAQTYAQLTTTSTTDSDASEPTLSNKEASKSPLKDDTDPLFPDSAVLEHSALQSRYLNANSSQLSAPTTTALNANLSLSMAELTEAASAGDANAQFELGINYLDGHGVESNKISAARWFSKAADQNLPEAQVELGDLYVYGFNGFNKDLSKGIALYLKAANQGYAKAQSQLGFMHLGYLDTSDIVLKNYEKAFYWLRVAADQGDPGGQEMLAELFEKGHGVKQSDEDAAFWYAKAAEQNSKSAQEKLAFAYKDGKGVKKDLNRSVYWQMKCNLNEDEDCIRDEFLDKSLSAGLTEFIAKNLIDGKEFKKVMKLDYTQIKFSEDEILGVCSLIRKNLKITSLILNSYKKLRNTHLQLIIDALDANTNLTEIGFLDFFGDGKTKNKIAAILARNMAIAKLRRYVLDYPLIHTASFALDPLNIIIDKTIVSYMINGVSKRKTKKAIDELLLGASFYELETELKKSS